MNQSTQETTPATQDFRLPAVDRAMSLFELLAASQNGLTLSELSRKLEMPKSTAHYLLHTLVTRGYIQRGIDGRHYSLGLRFGDMACWDTAEMSLRTLALPYLRHIVARVNLTATLAVRHSAEAVIIGKIDARQDAGGGAWVGRHIDLHCTAQGKSLISRLSDEELDKLFSGREVAVFTRRTISSVRALKAHLAEVRSQGYAVNDEENVLGVRAVAAPVVDSFGAVIASVTVRGSVAQIPSYQIPRLGKEVMQAAYEISQGMSRDRIHERS
ncbi:MAG TPA: IclR family transcriptional regulator [Terriglobales bacterium]|jgi:DNA-binding IclR family transcriptional regulator|nr:IclR family transcriptional regulator [Terriglobales bacterium]